MESEGDPKRSKPTNSSSKDTILLMFNLPIELIIEILFKLPVKSLLQLKSLSKSWLSFISSPQFVKIHLLLSTNNKDYTNYGVLFKVRTLCNHGIKNCSLKDLLYDSVTEAFDLDYPDKRHNDFLWLVGSINGLICLAISRVNGLYDLFIWNPSIRNYKKLPGYTLNQCCYYNEKPGSFKFGFSYDEFDDDYKVVGIFPIYRYLDMCRIEVKIYSLRSNSWKCISDFEGREFFNVPGKVVNRKLHWFDKGWKISCIDLCNEKWGKIEKPRIFEEYGYLVLEVIGSDLSVLCNSTGSHADVWVMKEYGVKESWTKMFTIKFPDNFMYRVWHPFILVSNECDFLLEIGSRLGKYNPNDDSIRYLDVTNFAPYVEAEVYVKSLVSPFLQKRPTHATTLEVTNNSDEDNCVTNNIQDT